MMEKLLAMQPSVNARGHEIDSLIFNMHWLMFALFIGWGIYFIFTLVRFRKNAHPKADYHGAKTHMSSYLEVAVAVIEVVLLVGFSIPIWAKAVGKFPSEAESVVVNVVAQQFAWNFQYPGADGKLGKTDYKLIDPVSNPTGIDPKDPNSKDDITTINQLYIPTGKPIIIKIS